MPAGVLAQAVGHGGEVVGEFRPLGQQAVGGKGLVERFRHEGIVDLADPALEIALQAGDDEIEIVEPALGPEADEAALGGLRVRVIEMLEIGRIFRLAHQREGMGPPAFLRGGARTLCEARHGEGDCQGSGE